MLALIGAITLAPVVASYAVYYFAPRSAGANYGTLLATAPAPELAGRSGAGAPFRLGDLKGRWVLVVGAAGRCDDACARSLYATRQARTMQGREQERIVRVLLLGGDAAPDAALLAENPGLEVAHVAPEALARLPGGAAAIVLIDPLGNLVLRYPADADAKGLARDLGRVLKASGIG
jgi:cytochrome oxidase Cu insertion factor (SCO1/SenC/PrrC family)